MDTTIRNLDKNAYRALKARAALSGKTVGETLNEAIRIYLGQTNWPLKRRTLRELKPESYPEGNERLSQEINRTVYGI